MEYLLLLTLFWKPVFWSGQAIYNQLKGNTWDRQRYFTRVKDWFVTLWSLLNWKT